MKTRDIKSVIATILSGAMLLVGAAMQPPKATAGGLPQELMEAASGNKYGLHASTTQRADAVTYATELGAGWVRLNSDLNTPDPDFKSFLEAGINVIITFNHRDSTNVDTAFGTPAQWPHAGFPYRSRTIFQQRIHDELSPLVPYLNAGRQVVVQCENEIGDASANPNVVFWRGTTDQYLTSLQAFYEAVKAVNVTIPVVLTSFASANLDAVVDANNPTHNYQVQRMTKLLSAGQYDAADLHFYGCVEGIAARAQWVKDRLPAGRYWISTENSGPAPDCSTVFSSWQQDLARFEQIEAQQVALRLTACADSGATICLWFSLFDLRGEADDFNHLGLLDTRSTPSRKKPAFEAFKTFVASMSNAPTLSALQILRKGKVVDFLTAGAKSKIYQINLNGSGFNGDSKVLLNGQEASVTFISSTQLSANLPFKKIPAAGMLPVQVRNADGQLSNILNLEIRNP
ncbi:MAG: hypothetical protein HY231_22845 [Acidobacteria bacterium]|nr:hypothetical protein [Acidobacteriota bacterium]